MPQTLIVEDDATIRGLLAFLLIREGIDVQSLNGDATSCLYLQTCPTCHVVILIDNSFPKFLTQHILTNIPTDPQMQRHSYLLLSSFTRDSSHPYHDLARATQATIFFRPFNLTDILTYIQQEVTRLQNMI